MIRERYQLVIVVAILLVALITWTLKRALVFVPAARQRPHSGGVRTLRSGDLLLFSSSCSWYDDVLKLASGCEFTHLGMVVLSRSGRPYVFESRRVGGAGIMDAAERLKQVERDGVTCVVRRLTPELPRAQLGRVVLSLLGTVHSARGILRSALGLSGGRITLALAQPECAGPLDCSELVSVVYARMKVLQFTPNWCDESSFIAPKNFTEVNQDLPMSGTHTLGPEEYVLAPTAGQG